MKSCVIIHASHRKPPADVTVKQLAELGENKFAQLKSLLRYDRTELWVYSQESMVKPFLTAWLMRLTSRQTPVIISDDGKTQRVDLGYLLRVTTRYIRNRAGISKLVQWMKDETIRTEALAKDRPVQLDLSAPSAYLRPGLVFGLRSGGSVGHIAGVINNLDHFSGTPIFLTVDRLPTVRTDLPTHLILPDGEFSDFGLLQQMIFNQQYVEQAQRILDKEPRLSFVYQRQSLNDFSGVALALRYKIPYVLEYNGSEIWTNRHWAGFPIAFEENAEMAEIMNLRVANLITVVSKPIKDQLIARGIEPNKILVNPNAVDADRYHPAIDGSTVRKRYGLEGKKVIGFIGTFGAWHGAEVLAIAFGKLLQKYPQYRENVRLLMVGDGHKMPLVKQNLQQYGGMDFTVLTGIVSQEQGAEHLAAADILASPHVPNPDGTPFFGSPTKLFEYMAMGKGIVASDLDQIGEILEHDVTAWKVKPGDVDDLVEGLKVLIDDPARSDRLGAAARKLVVAEYTWREHTRKIIEALKEAMATQQNLVAR